MKIIGICGKKRSGKDTAGEYLIEKYGGMRDSFTIFFLFQTPVFYFSYTYDLTNSQQRLASFHYAAHNNRNKSAAENQKHYRTPSSSMSTLNSTFAWNYNILRPFLGKVIISFGTGT